MSFSLVALLIIATGLVWYALERRESRRRAAGLPNHGGIRLIFAAGAMLLMIFAGGCSAIFLFSWLADGASSSGYVTWQAVAVLGGPPFLVGLLVWWLSMRRKKE